MAKVLIGNIKGPKGEQGPPGIQGIPGPAGADGEIDSNSLIEFEDYEGEGAPQLPSLEESLRKIESNISIGKWMSYVKAFNMNVSNFLKGVVTLGKLANNLTTTEEGFALDARQGSIIAAKNAQLENAIEELNSNIAFTNYHVTPAEGYTLTSKKIGNQVIVDIKSVWMQIYQVLVIGWTADNPILFATNCIRVVDGNGNLLTLGYANIHINDTSIKIYLPTDWANGTFGHIQGTFSYYLQ